MKWKFLPILLMALLLFVACDKKKINELNENVATLKQQNEQLIQENNSIKKYIEDVAMLVQSVDQDLDSIMRAETDIKQLSEGVVSGEEGQAAYIQTNIRNKLGLIGQYIMESRQKISDLEKQLATSRQNLKGLKVMVANLKSKLEEKESEIAGLMKEVGMLETDVARLGDEIKVKDQTIDDQQSKIQEQNKRFYIFASEKELQNKGIIEKEGGFLGLGRTTRLSSTLDTQYFTTIDMDSDLEINVPYKSDKLKFISPHQADTYEIEGEGDQTMIKITDPEQFWEASKCLVVAVK